MARKLPKPLIHDLIAVADGLVRQPGPATLRQACMRRAVSSAYYAVFHTLSFVCADALVGWSKTTVLPPIYRSLEHGPLRTRLRSDEARSIAPQMARLGRLVSLLQERRHAADYAPPQALFSPTEALALIDDARDAIAMVEALDTEARLRLAILLIARPRSA